MYGVQVKPIYDKLYPELKKILCLETAARYLGLSKGWGIPVMVYYDSGRIISSEYFIGKKVENLDSIQQIQKNGVYCTTPERTLCDLLLTQSCPQTASQSLITYYHQNDGDISELLNLAKTYSLTEKIQECLDSALEYYDE